MDANEAAKTLLLRGKEVEFPQKQAERMLAHQKVTGFTDYSDPDDLVETEPEAESQPTTNADHGQPSDSIDTNAPKPEGVKKGK
ncbi:hypothetical protein [Spirosoma radiotolerans]|uniref:Uncharacterized protein n=1 Tax=Spirosoma radiotolerans TaxID=1379870 RepID=A0A0E3V712_9BACT|nr:hypothetical protein [Spirosoma radiotolerans]AKD55021.1 hypothetical protein SD10_09010 [Spirosoma radiotolerans]